MDQTKIGKFIARKRKEHGLTQMQLAEKLSITDRAVSKWETGESYPDITFLPALANMFEKQKATMRAVLCFLYLKSGLEKKADMLASKLPHKRECREAIQPLISQRIQGEAIDKEIRRILLGLDDTDTPEYSEEKHL